MEISLTKEESEKMFHSALCNGLSYISSYGLVIELDSETRIRARSVLEAADADRCYEDILLQVLKNGDSLKIVDDESGDEYNITLALVHERVQKTEPEYLLQMVNETDDAITADCILQTVIFGEIIYG